MLFSMVVILTCTACGNSVSEGNSVNLQFWNTRLMLSIFKPQGILTSTESYYAY